MKEWANKSINITHTSKNRLDKHISGQDRTYEKVIRKLLDFWDDQHE